MLTLDELIPDPDDEIRTTRNIEASVNTVWSQLYTVRMGSLPLGRFLNQIRHLPALISGRETLLDPTRTFFVQTPIPVVHEDPPVLIMSAGVVQPWRLFGGPVAPHLDAAGLRDFKDAGWVKVAMEFSLEPLGPDRTALRTRTRVRATSPSTAFRLYWSIIRLPSSLIRREVVRVVARKSIGEHP